MGNPVFMREAQQPYFQEDPMKKYLIAAALIGAFVTPALSQAGEWYVGFDTATKKCSVVSSMPSGMKMMGKYKSKAEAETAMHGMKECKA